MRNAGRLRLMKMWLPTHDTQRSIDLPATFVETERERQLTMARAKQRQSGKLGIGSRVCPLRALSSRRLMFPLCC